MARGVTSRFIGFLIFGFIGWISVGYVPFEFGGFSYHREMFMVVAGCLGFIVGPYVIVNPIRSAFDALNGQPLSLLISGAIGLIVGLVIAALISVPLLGLSGWLGSTLPLVVSVVVGFAGLLLGIKREREIGGVLPRSLRSPYVPGQSITSVLVDTSAIIDGRIADIAETGFMKIALMVPSFILDELRHIADSSDDLRRSKGRRGLEILGRLRKAVEVEVAVIDVDLGQVDEVDSKLVSLAKEMGAAILTTDFNLNRVAQLQEVEVLNINDLADALKPILLPGEELSVNILQEGKESGQGVAYLDDGTMVVVEDGQRYLNMVHTVVVSRVLQTSAGRIIFADPKG